MSADSGGKSSAIAQKITSSFPPAVVGADVCVVVFAYCHIWEETFIVKNSENKKKI
jgi:hypothetical protein